MRHLLLLLPPLLLAGCGEEEARPRSAAAPARHAAPPAAGLGRVMGQDAATLAMLFGPAEMDTREGPARKLQFRGPACVLDAYLYPTTDDRAPRVTWIDARTPAGDDFDRASCIAALTRRSVAPLDRRATAEK